jgi:hypothetical protein
MIFALVNESSHAELTPDLLGRIANALVKQTAVDFSGMHESLPCSVMVTTLDGVPPGVSVLHLVDSIPEAPDALAYHTIDQAGRPVLRLGVQTILDNGGSLVDSGNSVSAACSHEVLETIGNPYVCWWSDFDGTKKVALEMCDPVEADFYLIDGIAVSNFVGPRWFDAEDAIGPFDFMRRISAPLTMSSGGYLAFDDGSQVFDEHMPEARREQKRKYGKFA